MRFAFIAAIIIAASAIGATTQPTKGDAKALGAALKVGMTVAQFTEVLGVEPIKSGAYGRTDTYKWVPVAAFDGVKGVSGSVVDGKIKAFTIIEKPKADGN